MNIFYLDADPRKCAQYHVDKHVVKMILEYAQLMSTAHRVLDGHESVVNYILNGKSRKKKVWTHPDAEKNVALYAATHINHPSAKWTRDSRENYAYLFELWCDLLHEYTYRYSKHHACERMIGHLALPPKNIPTNKFSPPWRAMPDECKVDKSVKDYTIKSYQKYYLMVKSNMFSWKNRDIPDFVQNAQE